ncbi:MAG: plastocyanin/azurin family copper-binding protein, partial [Chloroflexota bacterium]|nr:plastocyanin/azurin family copper-binding protein [Chloroflexota bacterium]
LLFIRSADSSYLQKNGYPSVNGFDNFVQYLQTNYPSAYATASAPPPSAADVFGTPVDMTGKKAITINIGDTLPANAPKNVDCSVGCYQTLNVKVKVGTTITWVNESKVAHTVTAIKGLSLAPNPATDIFDSKITSPITAKGGKFTYTVTTAAYNLNSKDHIVFYYCQIHPTTMYAELTIVP